MKKAIALILTTLTILGATAIGAFASAENSPEYPVEVAGMVIYEEDMICDFAAPEM